MVVVPRVSGSIVAMSGGGGFGGRPSTCVRIKLPRLTGVVTLPFAVTFAIEACPRIPPRGLDVSKETFLIVSPNTPLMS